MKEVKKTTRDGEEGLEITDDSDNQIFLTAEQLMAINCQGLPLTAPDGSGKTLLISIEVLKIAVPGLPLRFQDDDNNEALLTIEELEKIIKMAKEEGLI